MNEYEQKLEERRQRFEALAERAASEANAAYKLSRELGRQVPLGQPILVDHYSAPRMRAHYKRVQRAADRSLEASQKAEYYRRKAAAVGRGGISSDDPDAVSKLREKIVRAKEKQEYMKGANRAVRAAYKAGLRENSDTESLAILIKAVKKATGKEISEAVARELIAPDCCGRRGFPDYALQNNRANIRRMEKRLHELEATSELDDEEQKIAGSITFKIEDNRVQFVFPGKPPEEIRAMLKRHAFKWSPSRGAWVRKATANGMAAGRLVADMLGQGGQQ